MTDRPSISAVAALRAFGPVAEAWRQAVSDGFAEFAQKLSHLPLTAAASVRLLSAAEAERHLGIPSATVRSWALRGKLLSSGLDRSGRPLYAEANLLTLRDTPRADLPR